MITKIKTIVLVVLVLNVFCSSDTIKHFYNYSINVYIESTDTNRKEVLNNVEVVTKELLNKNFFKSIATEFNDTTLQKIANSGSFLVVNEYKIKISSGEKTNLIYIMLEFKRPNRNDGDMHEFSKIVTKRINYELEKHNLIICKNIKLNNYYN